MSIARRPSRATQLSLPCVVFLMIISSHLALAVDVTANGWPQFLGPNRNGLSTETGLIDSFGSASPKVVWRVTGGVGMSGIALDGKRAITLVERDNKQTVLALDASNGDTIWSQPVADAYKNGMGAGPRGTPTIVGDAVFVHTGDGVLAALATHTGKILWRHNVVDDLHGEPAEYGMACSPLVVDNLVVINCGVKGACTVAYHVDNGELAWQHGDDTAGYSSPIVAKLAGRRQIVTFTGKAVLGLDPKTGKPLWRYDYATNFDCNIATPLVIGDNVFIASGENHGCAMLSVKPDGDAFQVAEVWASHGVKSVMRNEWQTSLLLDGYLYGMDNVGGAGPITHLNCVNAKTGERVWQQARFGKGNLISADGKLYIITMSGELVIVRASPKKFEELSRAKVMDETRQAPSLLNGKLYLRDQSEIVCVDVKAPN